jgi:hypothetical protein
VRVLKLRYASSTDDTTEWKTVRAELLDRFQEAATSKTAVQTLGIPASRSAELMYLARFPRAAAESDNLSGVNFELPVRWERIIVAGIAAQMLAGRDIDHATQEFITEQLEAQGFPVGSGRRVLSGLITYRDYLIQKETKALEGETKTPASRRRVVLA